MIVVMSLYCNSLIEFKNRLCTRYTVSHDYINSQLEECLTSIVLTLTRAPLADSLLEEYVPVSFKFLNESFSKVKFSEFLPSEHL